MGEYISIQNKARVSHTRCASSIVRKRTISGQPYYFHSLVQRAALVVSLLISNAILPLVPSDQSGVPTLVNGDMPGRTTEERERERANCRFVYAKGSCSLHNRKVRVTILCREICACSASRSNTESHGDTETHYMHARLARWLPDYYRERSTQYSRRIPVGSNQSGNVGLRTT